MSTRRRLVPGSRAPRRVLIGTVLALVAVVACTPDGARCTRQLGDSPSVARVWNEIALDAIRRDFPAPTVHARNLFHLSAVMWDAWAAFDPEAAGYFVAVDAAPEESERSREVAIGVAAADLLRHRYADTAGSEETLDQIDQALEAQCLTEDTVGEEKAAADLGARIAASAIEFGLTDGSNETDDYADPSYEPVNPPLSLARSGTDLDDPDRWQPLDLDQSIGQNGLDLPDGVQQFVGSQWGSVQGFALSASDGLPIDPGVPPSLRDPATSSAYRESALEVVRFGSQLDARADEDIDISPGSRGNNPIGTYDGVGHQENPVTGAPYDQNVVDHADFGRVIAEFWADGPDSETPPGHWNTLLNEVSDNPELDRRLGGAGPTLDRLEWDVKTYFALNGATHDAAIAAWGSKAVYDYVRPISMIRYLGQNGQSTDPEGPSFTPVGLPLEPGISELATEDTVADGGRHAETGAQPGEVVVRGWTGIPLDPEIDIGGVRWIRAADWIPYQRDTFVTPAFAGYVSGHSTFSRAAAEVLAAATGSEYFPGGLGSWTVPAGDLEFDNGPIDDVVLEWATYADAADQAGISRLYGGIHVRADDLAGRVMGAEVGKGAWVLATDYFAGTADLKPGSGPHG